MKSPTSKNNAGFKLQKAPFLSGAKLLSRRALRIVPEAVFRCSAAALALFALFGFNPQTLAATDTWTGAGSGSTDWATTANWSYSTGTGPVATGDALVFTGTTSADTAGTNILTDSLTTSTFNIAGITFTASAPAYTMTGNAFAITAGIVDSSTNTETIDNAMTLAATHSLDAAVSGADLVIGGALNGAGGITTNGPGTVVLDAANTNTGTTTAGSGTLQLNFAAAGAPTSNIIANTALSMGGGALQIIGASGIANTQSFASTAITAGQSVISAAPSSGSTLPTVTLNALTLTAPGNMVEYIGPATIGASNVAVPATATITTTTPGGGALGAFYNPTNATNTYWGDGSTVGLYDFASTDTTGGAAGTTIIGGSQVTGFYQSTGITTTSAAYDVPATGGVNASGGSSSPLVRFNAAAADSINFTAATASGILAILVTPNVGANNDALTANSGDGIEFVRQTQSDNGFGSIIQNNTLGYLNFSAIIEPGREAFGGGNYCGLIQGGPGTVVYSGVNLYELSTYLNGGYSVATADSAFGNVADGGATEHALVTTLYLNGGTVVGNANFTMDNLGANKRPVTLLSNGGGLAATAGNTMTIDGVVSSAGTSNLPLVIGIPASSANSNTAGLLPGSGAGTANTTAVMATGTVVLNGANTYVGGTVVDTGVLNINGINAVGGANYGGLTLNGGTLQYATGATGNGSLDLTSIGTAGLGVSSTGGTIDTNGNAVTYAGSIGNGGSGPLTVISTTSGGSLTLNGANTFTGALNVNSGSLTLGGANVNTGLTSVTGGKLTLASGGSLGNTAVTVSAGATLQANSGNNGIGTGSASLTLNGGTGATGSTLSLVDGTTGTLNLGGNLTVGGSAGAANLDFELNSTTSDELVVSGGVLGGAGASAGAGKIFITTLGTTAPANGQTYTLISAASGLGTSLFALGTTSFTYGTQSYTLNLTASTGTAEILTANFASLNYYWTGASLTTPASWSALNNFATDHTGSTTQSTALNSTSNVFETADSAANYSQTLDGSYTINSLNFTGLSTGAATNSVTIANGTGTNVLTITAGNSYTDVNANSYGPGVGLVVQAGSAAHLISAAIDLGANQTWQINNSSTAPLTVSGVIADGTTLDGLTKAGGGTLILSNAETYNGGTTVNGGLLQLGNGGSLLSTGALTVSGTGTFDLNGRNQAVGSLSDGSVATGTITDSAAAASTLTDNNSTANTFSGSITDNGANNAASALSVILNGTGNITLSGSNSYHGLTTINNGITVVASNNHAFGNASSASGGLLLNPASGTAIVDFNSLTPSIASLASGGAGTSSIVLGNATAGTATTLTVGGGGATTVYNGTISDGTGSNTAAIGSLTLAGGSLTLNGADTFTGTTILSGGTLTLGNSLALEDSTLNYSNQGGTLSFGTLTAASLGGLTGAENIALTNTASAAVALTIGGNNSSPAAYSGALSGAGSLTMNGNGTNTLSGANTYTGTTTVSAGTLAITNALGTSAAPSGAITVNGGTLNITGATVYAPSLSDPGTNINISGNASVTLSGALNVDTNNGNAGGVFTLTGGTVSAGSISTGRSALNLGAAVVLAGVTTNGIYVNGGTLTDGSTLTIGNASLSSSNFREDAGAVTVAGTTLIYDGNNRMSILDISGGTFTSNDTTGAGIQLGNLAGTDYGELLVRGTGTLNVNTITLGTSTQTAGLDAFEAIGGSTYIGSGGIVTAGSGFTLDANIGNNTVATAPLIGASAPWSSSVPLTLTNSSGGVAPTFQAANALGTAENITLTGALEGAGGLTKTGAGTLTLTAANGYFGLTSINGGTLNINGEFALGGADYSGVSFNGGTLQYATAFSGNGSGDISIEPVTFAGNGTIDTNGNAVTYANAIGGSGPGGLTVADSAGTGSLTLSSPVTYTGATTINAGATLKIASASVLPSATIVNSGTLYVPGTGTLGATGGTGLTLNGGSDFSMIDGATNTLTLPGNLTIGTTTGAALNFELNNTSSDSITVDGSISYGAGGGLIYLTALTSNSAPLSGTTYTLLSDAAGLGSPVFTLETTTLILDGSSYSVALAPNGGNTAEVITLTALSSNLNYYFTGAHTTTGTWSDVANFATDHTGASAQNVSLSTTSNVFLVADNATPSHFQTETLDGTYTINSLSFTGTDAAVTNTPAATNSIALNAGTTGGPLTLTATNGFSDTNGNNYVPGTGLVVQAGSAAHTINANINLGNGQIWEIDNSPTTPLTVNGVIANGTASDSLTKIGQGKVILNNAETYTGGTTVSGGTLALGSSGVLPTAGTLTVSGSGTFDVGGNNVSLTSLSDGGVATGTITNSAAASVVITFNNSSNTTFRGTITDNGATNSNSALGLNMDGTGVFTLSGSNSFNGATTVNSGTLVAANNYALGNSTSANGGLVLTTGTVDFTSASPNVASLNNNGANNAGAGTSIVLGNSTAGTATTLTLGNGGASISSAYGGIISDLSTANPAAVGNLTVSGGSYLILSNANTFTGITTLTGANSEIALGTSLALEDSTLNYNTAGTIFSFGSLGAATLGALSGSQPLALTSSAGSVILTLGNNNESGTFTGNLSGGGGVSKIGSGTETLSDATYTGNTTVYDGTLDLNGSTALVTHLELTGQDGISNANITGGSVVSNSGLYISSSTGGSGTIYGEYCTLTISGGAQVTANADTNGRAISYGNGGNRPAGAGSLTIGTTGDTTTVVTANGAFDLYYAVGGTSEAGSFTLNLNGGTLAANLFQKSSTNGTDQTAVINLNGGTLKALANDTSSTAFFLPALGATTVDVDSGGAFINTNGFNDTIAAPLVHGTGTPDGGLTLNDTAATAGSLTLSGANTFTGPTTVTRGTLIVTGALSATSGVNVNGAGTLEIGLGGTLSTSAPLTLTAGTLQTLASQTDLVGSLTLGSGVSHLTLGATTSIIKFADSSANTWSGTLAINDWNGSSAGGGSDELFIGTSADLTTAQLADITFIDPTIGGVAHGFNYTAVQLSDGELVTGVAVPEPGTWAMLLAGVSMLGIWQQRKRRAGLRA